MNYFVVFRYHGFVKRHSDQLSVKNVKIFHAWASMGIQQLRTYFYHLQETIDGIPPTSILTYDEKKTFWWHWQQKWYFVEAANILKEELIIQRQIFLIFSCSGWELLPCYVASGILIISTTLIALSTLVRNSFSHFLYCRLINQIICGAPGLKEVLKEHNMGGSKSVWFDAVNFEEWFIKIVARRNGGQCWLHLRWASLLQRHWRNLLFHIICMSFHLDLTAVIWKRLSCLVLKNVASFFLILR